MQSSRSNVRTWQRREKDGQKLRRGLIRTIHYTYLRQLEFLLQLVPVSIQYVISEPVSLTHVLKYTTGNFTNDDSDGSGNVLIKINSRFFKRRRDYSNSL